MQILSLIYVGSFTASLQRLGASAQAVDHRGTGELPRRRPRSSCSTPAPRAKAKSSGTLPSPAIPTRSWSKPSKPNIPASRSTPIARRERSWSCAGRGSQSPAQHRRYHRNHRGQFDLFARRKTAPPLRLAATRPLSRRRQRARRQKSRLLGARQRIVHRLCVQQDLGAQRSRAEKLRRY